MTSQAAFTNKRHHGFQLWDVGAYQGGMRLQSEYFGYFAIARRDIKPLHKRFSTTVIFHRLPLRVDWNSSDHENIKRVFSEAVSSRPEYQP